MNEFTAECQAANRIAAQLRGLPSPKHRAKFEAAPAPKTRTRASATGIPGKSEYLRVAARARMAEVLAYCHQFFAENDQLPPQASIASQFGFTEQVAQKYMHYLADAGHIERNVVGKWRWVRKEATCAPR